jgi:hypothetical protein
MTEKFALAPQASHRGAATLPISNIDLGDAKTGLDVACEIVGQDGILRRVGNPPAGPRRGDRGFLDCVRQLCGEVDRPK